MAPLQQDRGNYVNREYVCRQRGLQVAPAASVVESSRINTFDVGNEMHRVSSVLGAASCPSVGLAGSPFARGGSMGELLWLPRLCFTVCLRHTLYWPVPVTSPSGTRQPPALARAPSPASHRSCCPSLPLQHPPAQDAVPPCCCSQGCSLAFPQRRRCPLLFFLFFPCDHRCPFYEASQLRRLDFPSAVTVNAGQAVLMGSATASEEEGWV